MPWTVEVTDNFERWWDARNDDERVSIDGMIRVLEDHGPDLGPPYSTGASGSRFAELLQLRVPHEGGTICVLYAVEAARNALVLLTGSTGGTIDQPCPVELVSLAESIFTRHVTRSDSE